VTSLQSEPRPTVDGPQPNADDIRAADEFRTRWMAWQARGLAQDARFAGQARMLGLVVLVAAGCWGAWTAFIR
jgi:hypothetical protein